MSDRKPCTSPRDLAYHPEICGRRIKRKQKEMQGRRGRRYCDIEKGKLTKLLGDGIHTVLWQVTPPPPSFLLSSSVMGGFTFQLSSATWWTTVTVHCTALLTGVIFWLRKGGHLSLPNQPTDQPNQSTTQPVNQPTNQPTNINLSIHKQTNQSTNQPANRPANQTIN